MRLRDNTQVQYTGYTVEFACNNIVSNDAFSSVPAQFLSFTCIHVRLDKTHMSRLNDFDYIVTSPIATLFVGPRRICSFAMTFASFFWSVSSVMWSHRTNFSRSNKNAGGQSFNRDMCDLLVPSRIAPSGKSLHEFYSIRDCCDCSQFDRVLVEQCVNCRIKEAASHYGKSMTSLSRSIAKI